MHISGPVLVLGDDVSTDLLYPGKYLTVADRIQQARHALEGFGQDWPVQLHRYPILAGGWNLGCGSSREQAATALLGAGVRLVVARSFSRLFLRNCVNNGLAVIESDEIGASLATDDVLSADLQQGKAQVGARHFVFTPLPDVLLAVIRDGGLLARLRQACAKGDA